MCTTLSTHTTTMPNLNYKFSLMKAQRDIATFLFYISFALVTLRVDQGHRQVSQYTSLYSSYITLQTLKDPA